MKDVKTTSRKEREAARISKRNYAARKSIQASIARLGRGFQRAVRVGY